MKSSSIKRARKAASMTQEELAAALGVNRATISKYESGDIPVTVQQLEKIAQVLHTTVYELIGDELHEIVSEKAAKPISEVKARLIGAVTVMDEENAEKLWRIVENMYTAKE